MGAFPDLRGGMGMSVRQLSWMMYTLIVVITGCLLATCVALHSLCVYDILDVFAYSMLLDWYAVLSWAIWFVCCWWGVIALSMPARPRSNKRRALIFWLFLVGAHIIGHSIYIATFCKRTHNFFLNSLAGNVAKETLETFLNRARTPRILEHFLYVAVPVANWVSAPYVYQFYQRIPPFDILFWCGWNWVIVAFVIGVIPLLIFLAAIPIVLGYVNAIDHGGNGTEYCKPSRIAFFYSLHPEDRGDVRAGVKHIEDFLFDDTTTDESNVEEEDKYRDGRRSSSLRSYTGSGAASKRSSTEGTGEQSTPVTVPVVPQNV